MKQLLLILLSLFFLPLDAVCRRTELGREAAMMHSPDVLRAAERQRNSEDEEHDNQNLARLERGSLFFRQIVESNLEKRARISSMCGTVVFTSMALCGYLFLGLKNRHDKAVSERNSIKYKA